MKQYDNGLRLVHKPMNSVHTLSIGVWVGSGSAFEDSANNGISHYIEHMLFKGTARRSAFEIADCADRIGAQINAFTAKECTCYYTKSIDEHAEACFDLLGDLFFNALFNDEDSAKEKGVICEEISMVDDTPEDVCHELLSAALFDGHTLGQRILGTAENVRRFTRSDVASHMNRLYNPQNVVVAVAGNLSANDADRLTQKYFLNNFKPKGQSVDFCCAHTPTPKFLSRQKTIEQANIGIAFPSINFNHPATYPIMIFNNIFGASMSCRLYQRVREQLGLAYSVYAYLSSYKNCGMYSVFCGTNPDNTQKAVAAIASEITKISKDGITKDEFMRGKEQLKSNFIMGQENTSSVMNVLGKTMLLANEPFNLDNKIKHINSITFDDVQDCFRSTLDLSKACASYVAPNTADILSILNN